MTSERDNKTATTVLLSVVATLVVGVVGALGVAYSGWVDVSATAPASGITRWFLTTTRDRSIAVRASDIEVPALDERRLREIGADHYHEMCAGCHGAPGVEADEAAQGMDPPPPELYRGPAMTQQAAARTFWVVKNGIKMTAMPAFGKTHDDHKIWAIVAFVKQLRNMTPADYRRATASKTTAQADGDAPASAAPSGL